MTGSTEGSTGGPAQQGTRWPARVYGLVVAAAVLAAFAGLPASNFWTDELFTLHVVGHDGGLAEVWRRALTDTHPPLYYVLLYGWTRLGGYSEAWMRLPSAVFAVVALAVAWRALRRRYSAPAVGFALAVFAVSDFWFEQSQNARSYALAMLMSAVLLWVMLALKDRWRDQRSGWPQIGLLLSAGLAASFVHAYLLLCVGVLVGIGLLHAPGWRQRVVLAVGGLLVLACNFAYAHLLFHTTTQDLHGLWFRNSVGFFWSQTRDALGDVVTAGTAVAVATLAVCAWRMRGKRKQAQAPFVASPGTSAAGLSLLVLVGMIASGILVSYVVAPSYSARNLLTACPFLLPPLAWLYEAAGLDTASRLKRWITVGLVLLVLANLSLVRGRWLERNENWRDTAAFAATLPGCAGQDLPVMQPYKFGPSTPEYRHLAERAFYGHYAPAGTSIHAWLPSELLGWRQVPALQGQLTTRANAAGSGRCALLLWAVHDINAASAMDMAQQLARQPWMAGREVVVQSFVRHKRRWLAWNPVEQGFVFYARPHGRAVQAADPSWPEDNGGARTAIAHLGSHADHGGVVDVFEERRMRHSGSEDTQQVQVARTSCPLPPAPAARSKACFDLAQDRPETQTQ